MNYLYEKVSYLKGLSEGLSLDETTKEGKVLLQIIDALDDFAVAIYDLDEELGELVEFVDAIDSDLDDLEEDVYGELDEDDEFEELECPCCGEPLYIDEDDYNDEGELELACPNCDEEN